MPKGQATLQGKAVSPSAIRGLVAQFIVNDMLPLSTVESPSSLSSTAPDVWTAHHRRNL